MSIARKCNVCNKFYDEYDDIEYDDKQVNGIRLTMQYPEGGNFFNRSPILDLCPECMNKLIQFIERGKEINIDEVFEN